MSHKDKVAANKARTAPKIQTHWTQDLAMAIVYKEAYEAKYTIAERVRLCKGPMWEFRSRQYLYTYHEALGYTWEASPGRGRAGMRKFVRTSLILPKAQMTRCGHSNEGVEPKDQKHCRFAQGCTDCLPDKQGEYVRAITRPERALAARIRRRDLKARPSLLNRIAASTEAARKASKGQNVTDLLTPGEAA